jgi:alpha-beta hydrolase superfamily lysophospholipase
MMRALRTRARPATTLSSRHWRSRSSPIIFRAGGSHLVIAGAKHEILQERDRHRAQFWAAFDAFVPGTPLFG